MSIIPTNGLVFYAPLEEAKAAADIGPALNAVGNIAYSEYQGIPCAHFDGASGITFDDANFPSGTAPFTMSCHINLASYAEFFGYGNNSPWQACLMRTKDGKFAIERASGQITSSAPITDGQWHHAACTYDGQTLILYMDGVAVFSQDVTFNLSLYADGAIGRCSWNNSDNLTGYIAACRIYNRALDSNEVKTLSKEFAPPEPGPAPNPVPTDGLVFYDSFRGDAADTGQARTVMGNMQLVTEPFSNVQTAVSPGGSLFMYSTDGMADNTGNRTFSIWVKGGILTSGSDWSALFCAGQPSAGKHTTLNFRADNKVAFSAASDPLILETPENALNQLAWNHIVLTQETNGASVLVSIYINNILAASGSRSVEVVAGDHISIGGGYWSNAIRDAFTGTVMAPRLYNRVLTNVERAALYCEFDSPAPAQTNIALLPSGVAPKIGTPGVYFPGSRIFIPSGNSQAAPAPVIPSEGLVFYAPLKAAAATAETGQALSVTGAVSYQALDGVPCAYFGENSWISGPDNNFPTGSSPCTLSGWCKSDSPILLNEVYRVIFQYGYPADNNKRNMTLWCNGGEDGIVFNIYGNPRDNFFGASITSWHHYAITAGDNSFAIYIDGVKVLSRSLGFNTVLEAFRIGEYHNYIAACRLYNRYLSEAEIRQLAREFTPE